MFEYRHGYKDSNRTLKEVFHFLDNFGFSFYRVTPLGLEKIKFFTIDMENYMYANYVAIKP